MGNYIANQYSKMMVPREPTINSIYYDAAIYNYKNKGKDYCLKFDRILDAENQIYIGIGSRDQTTPVSLDQYDDKTISLQAIRLGDYTNKYYRLLQFTENDNKLKYEFEDDITLTLKKVETVETVETVLMRFRENAISLAHNGVPFTTVMLLQSGRDYEGGNLGVAPTLKGLGRDVLEAYPKDPDGAPWVTLCLQENIWKLVFWL